MSPLVYAHIATGTIFKKPLAVNVRRVGTYIIIVVRTTLGAKLVDNNSKQRTGI